MNRNATKITICAIMCAVILSLTAPALASHKTIFEMPVFDVEKIYTYNTTFDIFVTGRNGKEAVLYWDEKKAIDGKDYYIFNLTKLGGGEMQFIGVDINKENVQLKGLKDYNETITFMNLSFDPETLITDYPLWVGKTWERRVVNFSGTVWMGHPVYVEGTTWGSAKVIGEEDITVPAGVAHTLLLETSMDSKIIFKGREMWMNTSQKIWLMENGFFAKRQLYHDGRLEEELELKGPILAEIDIKPEILNLRSWGKITASIELPDSLDVSDINLNTIELNGAKAVDTNIADDKLIVKFDRTDMRIAPAASNSVLLTLTGKFMDETLFEGFDTVEVIK